MQDSSPLVPLHWIDFGYAALVAPGGITGYAKAGSVPSLAAGLLFSGLAGLGTYQLSQDPEHFTFPSYFWNLGWHYRNEIQPLCQFDLLMRFRISVLLFILEQRPTLKLC
uniref:Transmembrane protein 14C n=1 Tax=Moschus moschiferus TaxID=68415 RepID=A0A8C6FFU4_MOSMO